MASPPDAKGSREGEDRRGSNDVDGPELGYPLVERRRADRATTWDGIERRTGPAPAEGARRGAATAGRSLPLGGAGSSGSCSAGRSSRSPTAG